MTVTDTLPAGLTPTAANNGDIDGWTVSTNGQTITATRSDAVFGGNGYPALTLTVAVANNAPANVTNTATVSGGGEITTTNNTSNDPTTIVQKADLTIAKTHTGNFRQGDAAATYTITVTNASSGASSGTVTVSDTLPVGLTPTVANNGTINGWTVSTVGQTVTATRSDTLAGSASYPSLPITVAVANNAPANVINTATVSGGGELLTGNNSASDATTIIQAADLTIAKSHSGNFRQGNAADTYTITVTNSGPGPTTGTVTVSDTLPAELTPTAANSGVINGWTVSTNGQTVTATRSDTLASAGSYPALTLTVAVANNAPVNVTNTATVSGGGELNTANNSATDPTIIIQVADLTITKSHGGAFRQGDRR